jgi:hypothetical protein
MAGAFDQAAFLATLEQEEATLQTLLAGFDDEAFHSKARPDGWNAHAIVAHVADATYGLALMILGEIPVSLPVDETTGWMDLHDYNEQRRQKNAQLSRAKLNERLAGAFQAARRALASEQHPTSPGPTGGRYTRADWHQRLITHIQDHRAELEALIG